MKRQYQSSITVFLCLLFLVFFMIVAAAIDFTRIFIGRAQIERALNSAVLSTLAGYNESLKSQYGLLYIDKNGDKIRSNIIDLMNFDLNPPSNVDGFKLYSYAINKNDPNAMIINENNPLSLSNTDELKTQILEYSKYLAPLDIDIKNHNGQFITGNNSDQLQGFTNTFLESLNFSKLIDDQITIDKSVNDLFEANNILSEDIDCINNIYTSPLSLATELENTPDISTALAQLQVYRNELVSAATTVVSDCETQMSIIRNTDFPNLYTQIGNAENQLNASLPGSFLYDNKALYTNDSFDEMKQKLGFYKNGLDGIRQDINLFSNLNNSLNGKINDINDLINYIDQVIADVNASDYPSDYSLISDAIRFDAAMQSYLLTPMQNIHRVMAMSGWKPEAYTLSDDESNRIFDQLKDCTSQEVMPDFFNGLLLGYETPGNRIYNQLPVSDFSQLNSLNVFAYDPANPLSSWQDTWGIGTAVYKKPMDDSIQQLNRILGSADPAKTGDARVINSMFTVADFADTVMSLTKARVDATNTSGDQFLDQFLIDYYSMQNFKSYTTMADSKKNMNATDLSTLSDRLLNYELEYYSNS